MKKIIKGITLAIIICLFVNTCFAQMKYGSLHLLSKSNTCVIFLNEENKGKTPVKIDSIAAGSYLLRAVDNKSLKTVMDERIIVNADEITTIIVDDKSISSTAQTNQNSQISVGEKMSNLTLYNSEKKDPGLSSLLSFLIVGSGQAVNGNWPKAIGAMTIAIASYLGATATRDGYYRGDGSNTIGQLAYIVNWLFWTRDAYLEAEDINNKLKVKYGISSMSLPSNLVMQYSISF